MHLRGWSCLKGQNSLREASEGLGYQGGLPSSPRLPCQAVGLGTCDKAMCPRGARLPLAQGACEYWSSALVCPEMGVVTPGLWKAGADETDREHLVLRAHWHCSHCDFSLRSALWQPPPLWAGVAGSSAGAASRGCTMRGCLGARADLPAASLVPSWGCSVHVPPVAPPPQWGACGNNSCAGSPVQSLSSAWAVVSLGLFPCPQMGVTSGL